MKGIFIFLIVLILGIFSCKTSSKVVEGDENFEMFYDRFHTDMKFQMERIQFPLEGGSAQVDETIPWTKDNWITMKVKIYDIDKNQYEVYSEKEDDLFIQGFRLKGSGFGAEYRFKKINKKWYLVYALDSNL